MSVHTDRLRTAARLTTLAISVTIALIVAAVVLTILSAVVRGVGGLVDLLRVETVDEEPMPVEELIGYAAFQGWHCHRPEPDAQIVVCEPRPLRLEEHS